MNPRATRLTLETLETREVPAVAITVDYSLDLRANGGSGFFEDHAEAKIALNQVASEMGQRVTANFSAITPSNGNTWSALMFNPETGQQLTLTNLNIAANTLVVYVGGRALPNGEAGQGGFGGYGYSGSTTWGTTVTTRGWSGFATWGGSIAFDTTENWHFGLTTTGLDSNETDFYSVATHEMGHLLGIGTATQWFAKVQGSNFIGSNAQSAYGGPVPLAAGGAHWADGITVGGQVVSLDPTLNAGTRVPWSSLDQAALRDLGWNAGSSVSPPVTPPVSPPPPPPATTTEVPPVLVSGANGQVDLYARNTAGTLAATGKSFTPFPGYTGSVRTAVADFNGDGTADYAFGVGLGLSARTKIYDGATGALLVKSTGVLNGFTGGVFLAAGDIDRDGKAELVASADSGGQPLVEVYRVSNGVLVKSLSFFPVASTITSGIRVAMGDLNRDGAADLIIGTGAGRTPKVKIYDGASLATGQVVMMAPAFLPFGTGLTVGTNISAGDINGDGYDDLIVSQDSGGTSLVRVWSGSTIASNRTTAVSNLPTLQEFYANGTTDLNGIRIAPRDLDHDGKEELITSPSGGTSSWLRVLSLGTSSVTAGETVFPTSGVYVG